MKYKNVQNYPVRKRLKLISLGLLPIATAVTFVACVSQDSAKLQTFKYLAIGDSVTAGFNQETYRDFQGKLNSQGGGRNWPFVSFLFCALFAKVKQRFAGFIW
ncbi:hypothetical protein R7X13_02655 [Mesomycoplasma ovipneumoniae]|uniref:hypothetical protein n=1 Tax=Mesomycoplasma ovipneumoniae TaxID=29562 RepID=UPI002964B920|nr:hypothetical protein [Mesomycoplasma ovipneumoniae]MDW2913700.1 hypothetical protein [Mesomycoplasma ovipneumoniae]